MQSNKISISIMKIGEANSILIKLNQCDV